jgi:hypothetical protein
MKGWVIDIHRALADNDRQRQGLPNDPARSG